MQGYGFVGEYREAYLPLVTDEFYAVRTCALMRHEAPRTRTGQSVGKLEGRTHRVLCFVQSSPVLAETMHAGNGAKKLLQEVYLVRSQVVEITTPGDVALHPPGLVVYVVVQVTRRYGKAYLHVDDPADGSPMYQFLDLLEIGQVPAVVSHETFHPGLFRDAVHALCIGIGGGERFFYIDRLARLHGHDGVGGVARGWCGNIYGVDLRVLNEVPCIGVPFRYVVSFGIALSPFRVAAHHGHHARPLHQVEGWPTFLFRCFTAADESPSDFCCLLHYYMYD